MVAKALICKQSSNQSSGNFSSDSSSVAKQARNQASTHTCFTRFLLLTSSPAPRFLPRPPALTSLVHPHLPWPHPVRWPHYPSHLFLPSVQLSLPELTTTTRTPHQHSPVSPHALHLVITSHPSYAPITATAVSPLSPVHRLPTHQSGAALSKSIQAKLSTIILSIFFFKWILLVFSLSVL